MMHVLAIAPVWKRPDVRARFYRALKNVRPPRGWLLSVLIAGSEGEETKGEANREGFWYLETPNPPAVRLGHKFNALSRASRGFSWDYLWLLGSDGVMTPNVLELYERHVGLGCERIGLRDFWFYEMASRELHYFPGYPPDERHDSLGAGRLIRRDVVEACGWELWDDCLGRAMDHIATVRMDAIGTHETLLMQAGTGRYLLELRSEENLTAHRDLVGLQEMVVPHVVQDLL